MKLRVAFHNYVDDTMVSHTCLQLVSNMHGPGLDVQLVAHTFAPHARPSFAEPGVPRWLTPLVRRLDHSYELRNRWTQRRFLRGVRDADAVYLWPNTPIEVYHAVRAMGVPIFLERINTHRLWQRRILCKEFAELGLDPEAHGVTPKLHEREIAQLEMTDYVFSASPMVKGSLLEAGIEPERIIESSYGWSPARLRVDRLQRERSPRFTALFVGTLCIRKGVHRLLEAWRRADIDGELWLAGEMADLDQVPGIDALLAQPNVKRLDYVADIAPIYAKADLFVFPTFEEGGPLVTYEAMAYGTPVLVSPMGAGAVARADVDGIVCEPTDVDGWARALRRLSEDRDLCESMGRAGQAHVQGFTWAEVGRRRREAVLERLGARAGAL